MERVVVYRRPDQDCWYIKERADYDGLICYKTREKAVAVAHAHHPYNPIYVED